MQTDIEELRLERLRRRLTQYDLSARTGIRPDKISLLENGKLQPRDNELKAWKQALGMNEDGDK